MERDSLYSVEKISKKHCCCSLFSFVKQMLMKDWGGIHSTDTKMPPPGVHCQLLQQ